MPLCIEAHNHFRATVTSGCDICNFGSNYLQALVICACVSVRSKHQCAIIFIQLVRLLLSQAIYRSPISITPNARLQMQKQSHCVHAKYFRLSISSSSEASIESIWFMHQHNFPLWCCYISKAMLTRITHGNPPKGLRKLQKAFICPFTPSALSIATANTDILWFFTRKARLGEPLQVFWSTFLTRFFPQFWFKCLIEFMGCAGKGLWTALTGVRRSCSLHDICTANTF